MFILEQSIADWRKRMLAAGIQSPPTLDELESHLREEVARQIRSGADEQQVFEIAARQMGPPGPLGLEFQKMRTETWRRPLAWAAWTLFLVSFFLPAYARGYGWQCAGLSVEAVSWPEIRSGKWLDIHLALLTLANLLMLASPFLLRQFSQKVGFTKWLRGASFGALALAWSFLGIFLACSDGEDLKIGCYVWAASFLLLFLSTFQRRGERQQHA